MISNSVKQLLLRYSPKSATYISNAEIESFLKENSIRPEHDAFRELENYFLNEEKLQRRIFSDWRKKKISENIPIFRLDEFISVLNIRRYSRRTVKNYTLSLKAASAWFRGKGKEISSVSDADLLDFFSFLTEVKKLSASSVRIYRFSLQLYFLEILHRNLDFSRFRNLRKSTHLPNVLSVSEIRKILNCILNLKHRMIIALMYSSGLRVSEVVSLRVQDIDLERSVLNVRQGKGKKDRLTLLPEMLKKDMESFIQDKKHDEFLFISNQAKGRFPVHTRTVQKVLKAAILKSGIKKDITPHDLRHSFATQLLENGIDVRYIQTLLGHKNISTTMIYTKVANPILKKIRSPLDDIFS